MRIIVSFNGGGLTINFENIDRIINNWDHLTLVGLELAIVINATEICRVPSVKIEKRWLLTANEVYFDTRIEEEN